MLIRQCKEVLQAAKTQGKTLLVVGCRLCLPLELEREWTVVEFALPGKEALGEVLDGILKSAQLKAVSGESRSKACSTSSPSRIAPNPAFRRFCAAGRGASGCLYCEREEDRSGVSARGTGYRRVPFLYV